ncbi:MAG: Gfo/Idh/MocA family oxidoreductase [Candidatus Hydrogenedentota bacterium]
MTTDSRTRVAVVGARGVGRYHARWWALEGAQVCAIVGTSENTLEEARANLENTFGFDGATYTSLEELLENEDVDIVDVCSPHIHHGEHVRIALENRCHVLCEKPFIYRPDAGREELLAEAEVLLELAERRGRRLSVCLQYTRGADHAIRHSLENQGWTSLRHFRSRLEVPSRGRGPDPSRVWLDLAPHALSFLSRLLPQAAVDFTTLETNFEGYKAHASFEVHSPGDERTACQLEMANNPESGSHTRLFSLNGRDMQFEGATDERGVYAMRVVTQDKEWKTNDFMREFIRAFLWNEATVRPKEILVNLDWTLRVLEAARAPGVKAE